MKEQRSSLSKVIIVAALALAVGAVLYVKQRPLSERGGAPAEAEASAPEKDSAALPRLVDLGSNKCQSCLAMVSILEELTSEYEGRLEVLFTDVWEKPDEAERYGVQLIPTQVFFGPEGRELFRHEGFFSKEDILAKWKELGFRFDG